MVKTKKRGLSDKVAKAKSGQGGRTNPFEVKLNRQKHHVLGRKISKHDKGKPGVSRSRAINKVSAQPFKGQVHYLYIYLLFWHSSVVVYKI